MKNGCKVKGPFFHQTRRAVLALEYLDDAYQVFKSACKSHKVEYAMSSLELLMKKIPLGTTDKAMSYSELALHGK